jgi:diguanylate cyclase (GGDEF)-like protein
MWRSSVSAQQRQAFESAASGVTATLGTLLRRDTDFVATLRGVLTMQPRLTATGFNTWYETLNGSQRQVGSIGSAVVSVVSAGQLGAFEARRDADPAFRALVGRWLSPVARRGEARYCLLSEGGELIPVTSVTAGLVQQDWCAASSEVGLLEGPLLQSTAGSGQVLVLALDVPIIHTTFLEAAVYRRGAAMGTVAQRRGAVAGWVVSSFDMPAVIAAAIGHNHGLTVDLYHSNPAAPATLVGSVGSVARAGELARSSTVSIDGEWRVVVHGFPVVAGIGADWQAALVFGAGLVVSVLLLVLARSRERALRMVAQKTGELHYQASHDALTGLPNRRALIAALSDQPARAGADGELMLALFDLDGFKEYNDTFGHPAGDALLARLGDRLTRTLEAIGTAYRMGGDEFCVLAACDERQGVTIAARAAIALSETGEAFRIGCSYGIARLPHDASSPPDALRIADDRMYEHKTSRVSAGRQSTDVLLTALAERSPDLGEHLSEVATLASATAQRLGLTEAEIRRIRLAAELHDVGKVAIPDSILNRPGPLDEEEWQFMRRHTEIGERIVNAAPSLAHTAQLIRSSHERYDGHGYPDHLTSEQIPLGASIIAVCDSFDAMTSQRPYSQPITIAQALGELRRCTGTQFHPTVVQAFCELIGQPETTATTIVITAPSAIPARAS